MKTETLFFQSLGSMAMAVLFKSDPSNPKVIHYNIVEAVDYPELDHDGDGNEIVVIEHFNLIGEDGVVDHFKDANLIASGNIVIQFPEDKENPVTFTIEFQNNIIFNGNEIINFVDFLKGEMLHNAFLIANDQDINQLERVAHDFSV